MDKINLAQKIRELRKALALRQEDLAAKSGVSIGVIKEVEAARGNPTIDTLSAIFSVLGVTFAEIIVTGMKPLRAEIENVPKTIKGEKSDPKNQKSNTGVTVTRLSEPSPNTERDEQSHSQAGSPPQEMSEEINDISHPPSSETNKESFSPDRAQSILDIQSRLTALNERELGLVTEFLDDLAANRPASSKTGAS